MGNFVLGAIVAVGLPVYIGSNHMSEADARIEVIRSSPDFSLVNGQPDAGVVVKTIIKNVGKEGEIHVKAHLSTSEGEWDREQSIVFKAGERRELEWFFHEPTINASNIQSRVSAKP